MQLYYWIFYHEGFIFRPMNLRTNKVRAKLSWKNYCCPIHRFKLSQCISDPTNICLMLSNFTTRISETKSIRCHFIFNIVNCLWNWPVFRSILRLFLILARISFWLKLYRKLLSSITATGIELTRVYFSYSKKYWVTKSISSLSVFNAIPDFKLKLFLIWSVWKH